MNLETNSTILLPDVNKMAASLGNLSGKVALITGMISRKRINQALKYVLFSFIRYIFIAYSILEIDDTLQRFHCINIFSSVYWLAFRILTSGKLERSLEDGVLSKVWSVFCDFKTTQIKIRILN